MQYQSTYKLLLALMLSFICLNSTWASKCDGFFKIEAPGLEGRLIYLMVFDMHLDPGGLLGGVHYTESLAASYGLPQVGVKYANTNLRVLVEDHLTGQGTGDPLRLRLIGSLVDEFEPILLITNIIKSSQQLSPKGKAGDQEAQVLRFPL